MTTTPDLWRSGFIDNTSLTGNQDSGVVAPTLGDQFFAVWVDVNLTPDHIIARKFDSLGNPSTGEVDITPLFGVDALNPAAVRLPIAGQADGLAVAFESSNSDIFLRRTDAGLNIVTNL